MNYNKFFKKLVLKQTSLTETYKLALDSEFQLTTTRDILLRGSSLPTCSLLILEKLFTSGPEVEAATMDFYCSVGTAIHTHAQKWFSRTGRLYGNWSCSNPDCGQQKEQSTKSTCGKCQSEMTYQEIDVNYDIFSGHIDGLLKLKDGRFLLFDFKSTSANNVYNKKYLPEAKHLLQVSAYAAVVKKQKGLDIESLSILYIARDNPNTIAEYNIPFSDDLYQHTLMFLRNQIKGFKAAQKSFATKNVKYAMKYKLCDSYHEYKEEVERYFGFNACSLSRICFKESHLLDYFSSFD